MLAIAQVCHEANEEQIRFGVALLKPPDSASKYGNEIAQKKACCLIRLTKDSYLTRFSILLLPKVLKHFFPFTESALLPPSNSSDSSHIVDDLELALAASPHSLPPSAQAPLQAPPQAPSQANAHTFSLAPSASSSLASTPAPSVYSLALSALLPASASIWQANAQARSLAPNTLSFQPPASAAASLVNANQQSLDHSTITGTSVLPFPATASPHVSANGPSHAYSDPTPLGAVFSLGSLPPPLNPLPSTAVKQQAQVPVSNAHEQSPLSHSPITASASPHDADTPVTNSHTPSIPASSSALSEPSNSDRKRKQSDAALPPSTADNTAGSGAGVDSKQKKHSKKLKFNTTSLSGVDSLIGRNHTHIYTQTSTHKHTNTRKH